MEIYEVGDGVDIMITGMTGKYRARVVSVGRDGSNATPEEPYLKVLDDESWKAYTLKPGDYIITS